jgi:hypothetical protein
MPPLGARETRGPPGGPYNKGMATAIPDDAKPSMRLGLELLTAWYAADGRDFTLLEQRLGDLRDAGGGESGALAGLVQLCGVLLAGYAEGAGVTPPAALALLGQWLA